MSEQPSDARIAEHRAIDSSHHGGRARSRSSLPSADADSDSRAKRAKPTTPANVTHALLGMLVNQRASLDALRHEINDCWANVQDLQIAVTNATNEIKAGRIR